MFNFKEEIIVTKEFGITNFLIISNLLALNYYNNLIFEINIAIFTIKR